MSVPTVGVALMSYGTPRGPADVEAFYTDIRRGRPPTAEQLDELRGRYAAIGGTSPLAARTEAQRVGLQRALDARAPARFAVVSGAKHATPRVEDAVAQLAERGADPIVGLVLAPHYSRSSVGEYHRRAGAAAAERGLDYRPIDDWHALDAYVDFLAATVSRSLVAMPSATTVLFTAHSLPERALVDDPYPDRLIDGASLVAARAALRRGQHRVAWQSAGRTPEPWRGPDLLAVLAELAAEPEVEGALVCPHGFVAEHLEVCYDLDVEAARTARDLGLRFARTAVCNDDPDVLAGLAALVAAAGDGPARP